MMPNPTRRELESAACRHLSDDELREGVVSRKAAEWMYQVLCNIEDGLDDRSCNHVSGAIEAYEQETERDGN